MVIKKSNTHPTLVMTNVTLMSNYNKHHISFIYKMDETIASTSHMCHNERGLSEASSTWICLAIDERKPLYIYIYIQITDWQIVA
jgi:hypothetical protein